MIKPIQLSNDSVSFYQKFEAIRFATEPKGTNNGRPPQLPASDIIAGLAWHVMQPGGTFANHVGMLTGKHLSESALSERRQTLGTVPWFDAIGVFLYPVADQKIHPHAFYKGMRLSGVDGTTFNVANTPPMKSTLKKTKCRRGKAAFYRIGCVAAVELGTHSPITLRIGENGESEGALAAEAVTVFNEDDLMIGDRYYGNGKWAVRLMTSQRKPNFLLRVQERLRAATIQMNSDGSRLVKVLNPDNGEFIILREIKAKVRRPGNKWVKIRFWTNLLDHKEYPAKELIPLYAMRWEQEIAFREIKEYLHGTNLLLSHTTITAVQEICALFMAQAVIASVRSDTACKHDIPIMQVSFSRTLDACRNLCWLLAVAKNSITPQQVSQIIVQVQYDLVQQASKPRRKRSCPRRVRQPINKWPRLMKNDYDKGEFEYEIRKS